MKIRKITLNDFEDVNNLFMQLHGMHARFRPDVYNVIEKPTNVKAWDFESSVSAADKIFIGAEIAGKIAGFCLLKISDCGNKAMAERKIAYIDEIAVDEGFRRKGIGKLLFENAVKSAKVKGATTVELKVWSFNKEAIDFYKSLGMDVQSLNMEKHI